MIHINDFILLLVGESGTGKTAIAEALKHKYGFESVESYTTRPQRYIGEKGHKFLNDEEFNKIKNIVAYTEFDGYRYCATEDQVDDCQIYIIDVVGVRVFLSKYKGNKTVIIVKLAADKHQRYKRMRHRGDSIYKSIKRIVNDNKSFDMANIPGVYYVDANDTLSNTLRNVEVVLKAELEKFLP